MPLPETFALNSGVGDGGLHFAVDDELQVATAYLGLNFSVYTTVWREGAIAEDRITTLEDFSGIGQGHEPTKIRDLNASGTVVGLTGELDIDGEPIYGQPFFYNEGFVLTEGVPAILEPAPSDFTAAHPHLVTETGKIAATGYKEPVGAGNPQFNFFVTPPLAFLDRGVASVRSRTDVFAGGDIWSPAGGMAP
ncbi:MAG: hypothetical protein M3436_20960, partial [Pseudomonadota bacterium]|nr:hypothetical protein [Pseudomonadota bacterium]